MQSFTLAVIQNRPGFDKKKNIDTALALIAQAARRKAEVVCLPEIFYFPYELSRLTAIAENDGATRERLQSAARKSGIFLCTGSLAEREGDAVYNRSYLIDPQGNIILTYSKCHLFDVKLPGLEVCESAVFTPGGSLASIRTPLGVFGLLICYDIRFPEVARLLALAGTEVLFVPAAFNTITGPAHWHVMFRARAIENQLFVVAASPARTRKSSYRAFGHSLVIDPWGRRLAEAGTGEAIIFARLDAEALEDARARLPLLRQRREDLYK